MPAFLLSELLRLPPRPPFWASPSFLAGLSFAAGVALLALVALAFRVLLWLCDRFGPVCAAEPGVAPLCVRRVLWWLGWPWESRCPPLPAVLFLGLWWPRVPVSSLCARPAWWLWSRLVLVWPRWFPAEWCLGPLFRLGVRSLG
jgi:hypothetical protein